MLQKGLVLRLFYRRFVLLGRDNVEKTGGSGAGDIVDMFFGFDRDELWQVVFQQLDPLLQQTLDCLVYVV